MGSTPPVNCGPSENQADDFQTLSRQLSPLGSCRSPAASYQGLARLTDVTGKRLRVTRWGDGGGLGKASVKKQNQNYQKEKNIQVP